MPKNIPFADRFAEKVNHTPGCWLWTATIDRLGYGKIWSNGRMVKAHRAAYELAHGTIPPGMEVDHTCHNRHCVNPAHLRLATRKQNMENLSGALTNSQSGVRGVSWHRARSKWVAYVKHNGQSHFAGSFDRVEDAEAAAVAKRNDLFTHNVRDRSWASAGR